MPCATPLTSIKPTPRHLSCTFTLCANWGGVEAQCGSRGWPRECWLSNLPGDHEVSLAFWNSRLCWAWKSQAAGRIWRHSLKPESVFLLTTVTQCFMFKMEVSLQSCLANFDWKKKKTAMWRRQNLSQINFDSQFWKDHQRFLYLLFRLANNWRTWQDLLSDQPGPHNIRVVM